MPTVFTKTKQKTKTIDLKKIIAYSPVTNMNLVTIGIV